VGNACKTPACLFSCSGIPGLPSSYPLPTSPLPVSRTPNGVSPGHSSQRPSQAGGKGMGHGGRTQAGLFGTVIEMFLRLSGMILSMPGGPVHHCGLVEPPRRVSPGSNHSQNQVRDRDGQGWKSSGLGETIFSLWLPPHPSRQRSASPSSLGSKIIKASHLCLCTLQPLSSCCIPALTHTTLRNPSRLGEQEAFAPV
jgi:hypothetical protein